MYYIMRVLFVSIYIYIYIYILSKSGDSRGGLFVYGIYDLACGQIGMG